MQKIKFILVVFIFIFTTAACSSLNVTTTPTVEPVPTYIIVEPTSAIQQNDPPLSEAGVPRVSVEKAYAAWASGAAIIVDVRSKPAYDASHIPGALNIQLGEFETNINSIPLEKDQWIITYCT